jgi:hypothetical protein
LSSVIRTNSIGSLYSYIRLHTHHPNLLLMRRNSKTT